MPRDNFTMSENSGSFGMQQRQDRFDAIGDLIVGPPGPPGPQGPPGEDGKSAYQSAVDGGYQGTETEFNDELSDIQYAASLARDAADDAEAAAEHYPKIQNGTWWVWDVEREYFVDTGISAQGPKGDAGPGVPAGGTTSQVLAKASNSDYDTEWVDQSGGGGGTSNYNDLSNKPSINGNTLSGNKTAAQLGLGTYSKPSGGIPKSDLASSVRSSLGKADTALQSVPSTYRTAAEQDIIDAGFKAYNRTNTNIVCFGDSWTVGTGIAEADRPTKRFTAIVANKLDCTEFNFGAGAAGFIRAGNLFTTQINTANSQMTSEQKNNTGVVLIVGGVNDYRQQLSTSTQAQFVEGVVNTANQAHTVFPNALIVLGIGNTNLSYFPEKARQWYSAAISACERQLDFPSLVIKNLYNVISGNTSLYASDNLHPNENGHGAFGGYIANAILGGGQSVFSALGTVTLSNGVTLDGREGPTELTLWRVNDEIIVGAARFTFDPAITGAKIIGTIPVKSAPPSNAYYPFYNSDQHAGNIAITASGNMYLIPATGVSSIASGFNQQVRYMFGKPTNSDES